MTSKGTPKLQHQQRESVHAEIPRTLVSAYPDIAPRVRTTIVAGDGMIVDGGTEHYFVVGADGLANVLRALAIADRPVDGVSSVLDYACGYGRVARWLSAAFPDAEILGVDTDSRALAAVESALHVPVQSVDGSLGEPLGRTFDLIWVGSLFTHITEVGAARLLDYLSDHLTPSGVLVMTTHGQLVIDRLSSGTRMYGLSQFAAGLLLEMYRDRQYGFASYANRSDYGISVASRQKTAEMIGSAGLEVILQKEAGWARHQDVAAAVHPRGTVS